MKYTHNQWSVSSNYKDTNQESKTISVPDLAFATDFKKSSDEPNEASITNITGDEITSSEHIRFGATPVKNIYSGTNTDVTAMHNQKSGMQVLVEISENYTATHAVTGQEVELPCKGRIVLRFPTASCVTEEMINDLLIRTISSALATGQTDAKRLVQIARGALLPDGL